MGSSESTLGRLSRIGNEVADTFSGDGLLSQILRGLTAPDRCGDIDYYATDQSARQYMDCQVARGSKDQSLVVVVLIFFCFIAYGILIYLVVKECSLTIKNFKNRNQIVNLQSVSQQQGTEESNKTATCVKLDEDHF